MKRVGWGEIENLLFFALGKEKGPGTDLFINKKPERKKKGGVR